MSKKWVTVTVPEMTIEHYAQHVGVTARTVEGWIAKGLIPTMKIGRRRLVNVAARMAVCLDDDNVNTLN
ncbi:MAG: helix-turn-helix domain-containing protein [Cellvibrionaceae bacterium]